MLRLAGETRKTWIDEALLDLSGVLLDHAHCEKKAASTAVSFIFRYPEFTHMIRPLSELAREELRHFEQVLTFMERRNIEFVRQIPSTYAKKLMKHCRKEEPERMLDLMICASLIEARSCERMRILSEALIDQDPKLAQFYRGLLACEARHHQIYLDLIQPMYDKNEVSTRLEYLAQKEQDIVDIPGDLARMHS